MLNINRDNQAFNQKQQVAEGAKKKVDYVSLSVVGLAGIGVGVTIGYFLFKGKSKTQIIKP